MEGYIGVIQALGFDFAPRNWSLCRGQLIAVSQNSALFSLIKTIYGGDGQTTFALPDLRSRVPLSYGQGPGLPRYEIGEKTGSSSLTLTIANMPSHNHAHAYNGGSTPGTLHVSKKAGTVQVPDDGDFIGLPANNVGPAGFLYVPAAEGATNPTAAIAGATGGGFNNNDFVIANTGSNIPINIVQPILAINYSICLFGIFPSRN
ncbi:tail fiber protein [Thalassospira sp. NFXS8]|uniref:phage tail protein n=1 Tax=Thalassospira sp. NFXS8 TaxID=2819093 RepID=UPI0032DF4F78